VCIRFLVLNIFLKVVLLHHTASLGFVGVGGNIKFLSPWIFSGISRREKEDAEVQNTVRRQALHALLLALDALPEIQLILMQEYIRWR